MPPRKLKSEIEAERLQNRHCKFISTAKDAVPFATHLTRFSKQAPYDPKDKLLSNVHLGQRKLLMSEIQLLTYYYTKNPEKQQQQHPVVVYIGAAPGSHLVFLHTLFPHVRFILYDGAKFDPRLSKYPLVFETHNEFFTDDTCKLLKGVVKAQGRDLLFISDIRLSGDTHDKFEKQVDRDNALQLGWIKILKPKYSLLKFRLPYNLKHGQAIDYVKGKVVLQMWPPATSGESRLLVARANINTMVRYDFKSYEESLFYHNKWARRFCFPLSSVFADKEEQAAVSKLLYVGNNGYCTCYDCMAELYTLMEYIKFSHKNNKNNKNKPDLLGLVKGLNAALQRPVYFPRVAPTLERM